MLVRQGVLGLASLLVLAGIFWIVRAVERAPAGESATAGTGVESHAEATDTELAEPEFLAPDAEADLDEASVAERPRRTASTSSGRGTRRRAPIRGQLRTTPGDEPLAAVLRVRVRTGDLSFSEDVVTLPDGSFTTTQAFPRGFTLATVARPAGDFAFEHEAMFEPASDEEWPVRGPWPTFARGRVVDRRGEPLEEVTLALSGRATSGEALRMTTRSDGSFRLQGLAPRGYRMVLSRGFERVERRLVLDRGPNELGDVLVPFEAGHGEITGELRPGGRDSYALLLLRDHASGHVETTIAKADEETGHVPFRFQDVPAGDYALTVIGLDGARYEPGELSVAPPQSGLVFERAGPPEPFRPPVAGLDALDHTLLAFVHGRWIEPPGTLARDDVQRWLVVGETFRPLQGGGEETGAEELEPEAGEGRAFLFVESTGDRRAWPGSGPPVAGVLVLADGSPVAESDADGLALAPLTRRSERIEFALAGWAVHDERQDAGVTVVAMLRE